MTVDEGFSADLAGGLVAAPELQIVLAAHQSQYLGLP